MRRKEHDVQDDKVVRAEEMRATGRVGDTRPYVVQFSRAEYIGPSLRSG